MLRTCLDTVGIALACITDICSVVPYPYYLLRTFVGAYAAPYAFVIVHFYILAFGYGTHRTCLGAESAQNAEVIRISEVPLVIICLYRDPCLRRHILAFLIGRTDLRA